MDEKSGSGSGMNNPDHISKSLKIIFFGLIYLNSLRRIRGPGSRVEKLGFGMAKIRIRDPG
jgi:hypothetical protein